MSSLLFIPFQNYIRTLCEQNIDVHHVPGSNDAFVRYLSEDDVLQIPQHAGSMIVILSNFIGRAIGDSDESLMRQNATLTFLKRTIPGSGDPAMEIQTALAKSLEVMFDFYARLKQDKEDDDCGPLQYLRPELMTWQPEPGPTLENHYGWEMTVPFDVRFPAYNPNKWL